MANFFGENHMHVHTSSHPPKMEHLNKKKITHNKYLLNHKIITTHTIARFGKIDTTFCHTLSCCILLFKFDRYCNLSAHRAQI